MLQLTTSYFTVFHLDYAAGGHIIGGDENKIWSLDSD